MTEILSARNISKTYQLGKQDIPVLRGINLCVEEGEMVALLGQSGAGKSTLLYLLGLLDRPSSGSIQFDGTDISNLSANQRAA